MNDQNFDQKQLEGIIGEKSFRYSANWGGTDKTRLFTPVSNKEMAGILNRSGISDIKSDFEYNKSTGAGLAAGIQLAMAGKGSFDFADDMAKMSRNGGNYGQGHGVFPEDGTGGFIKFQNSNQLYNIYDAGNFLTDKAMNLTGVSLNAVKTGANANEFLRGGDSNTDQRAITNGFNYEGVTWKR